jgi:hypothetical protein
VHFLVRRGVTALIADGCSREPRWRDHTTVPGSAIMVLGIASATDDFAERATGH